MNQLHRAITRQDDLFAERAVYVPLYVPVWNEVEHHEVFAHELAGQVLHAEQVFASHDFDRNDRGA